MAPETATRTTEESGYGLEPWQGGMIGGIVGGLVFGVMMTMQMEMVIVEAIPGMYGLGPSGEIGWMIHMAHSAVLGVVFAAIVVLGGLGDRFETSRSLALVGLGYGLVLWLLLASFVMPAWVGAMTGMAPPVPDWNVESAMGHAVYGVLLGVVYAVLTRRPDAEVTEP
ncbi:histidine kinase [Natrialbaceae archaeon A-gly3]